MSLDDDYSDADYSDAEASLEEFQESEQIEHSSGPSTNQHGIMKLSRVHIKHALKQHDSQFWYCSNDQLKESIIGKLKRIYLGVGTDIPNRKLRLWFDEHQPMVIEQLNRLRDTKIRRIRTTLKSYITGGRIPEDSITFAQSPSWLSLLSELHLSSDSDRALAAVIATAHLSNETMSTPQTRQKWFREYYKRLHPTAQTNDIVLPRVASFQPRKERSDKGETRNKRRRTTAIPTDEPSRADEAEASHRTTRSSSSRRPQQSSSTSTPPSTTTSTPPSSTPTTSALPSDDITDSSSCSDGSNNSVPRGRRANSRGEGTNDSAGGRDTTNSGQRASGNRSGQGGRSGGNNSGQSGASQNNSPRRTKQPNSGRGRQKGVHSRQSLQKNVSQYDKPHGIRISNYNGTSNDAYNFDSDNE